MQLNELKFGAAREGKLPRTAALSVAAAILWPVFGNTQTSLTLGTQPGYPGVAVALPLTLRNDTNVTAAQFDLAYNIGKVGPAGAVLLGWGGLWGLLVP